jgi:hypothetical protein
MEDPSTIRRAVGVVAIDLAPYEGIRDRTNGKHQRMAALFGLKIMYPICSMFAICSFGNFGTGLFPASVAYFENSSGLI